MFMTLNVTFRRQQRLTDADAKALRMNSKGQILQIINHICVTLDF